MALTYEKLRGLIGHKAGYAPNAAYSDFSGNATQVAVVERILERGLGRFYDPPVLPGEREKHQWSFLTPTLTFDFVADQSVYDLPASFVEFKGPLVYAPDSTSWWPPVEIVGPEEVQRQLAALTSTGRPCVGGVRVKASQDIHKTAWELIVAPISDASYQVKARTRINPIVPGATGDVPLGGQNHENTIIEACLVEAGAMLDDLDSSGKREQRFMEFLQASVSHDRSIACAKKLPLNRDTGSYGDDWRQFAWSAFNTGNILTYEGSADN